MPVPVTDPYRKIIMHIIRSWIENIFRYRGIRIMHPIMLSNAVSIHKVDLPKFFDKCFFKVCKNSIFCHSLFDFLIERSWPSHLKPNWQLNIPVHRYEQPWIINLYSGCETSKACCHQNDDASYQLNQGCIYLSQAIRPDVFN